MGISNVFFNKVIVADFDNGTFTKNPGYKIEDTLESKILFLVPPVFTEDIIFRRVLNVRFCANIVGALEDTRYPRLHPNTSPFSYDTFKTLDDMPSWDETSFSALKNKDPANSYPCMACTDVKSVAWLKARINYGFALALRGNSIQSHTSANGPHLRLELDDVVGVSATPLYPLSETVISRFFPTRFQWSASAISSETLSAVELQSCKFRWRYLNDTSYTEKNLLAVREYVVPANTFQPGTIEWQIETTANSGVVTQSSWTRVTVAEPISTSQAISPKNTIIDGSQPNNFKWQHISANGTSQVGFDLQISRDRQQWETVLSAKTSETETALPAYTLNAGDLYWRVRTYNMDDVAGEWSESVHIIVIAAPAVPAVTVVAADPKFSIRWHQTEQQGYEISVNGTVVAKKYGASSDYTHNKYLAPGVYDVRVRIQNKYGYWSGWGECILTIETSDHSPIVLNAASDSHIVRLSWSAEDSYDRYIIYRNGVKIGETAEVSFVDQFAAGETEYLVRGIFKNNGKCQVSEAKTVHVSVESLMIAELADPKWIMLPTSTSSLRATKEMKSCSVTYSYFAGAALPDADVGEFRNATFELDCAWRNTELQDARAFEKLLGKAVVVKTPTGKVFAAVLENIQPEENRFWTAYVAQLTQIDTEDETI